MVNPIINITFIGNLLTKWPAKKVDGMINKVGTVRSNRIVVKLVEENSSAIPPKAGAIAEFDITVRLAIANMQNCITLINCIPPFLHY